MDKNIHNNDEEKDIRQSKKESKKKGGSGCGALLKKTRRKMDTDARRCTVKSAISQTNEQAARLLDPPL